MFSVFIALLPLLFNGLAAFGRQSAVTLSTMLGRGELLLISGAIAAAAIGEIIASGEDHKVRKLFAGGGCVLVLALTSLWFADISTAYKAGTLIDEGVVAIGSLIIFLATIITSGSCVALSEE